MSNMYFVTSDSLSDFMEVRYIIWAGNIEDLVLPGTWTISAGQKKLKSECPHMPESIKTLWEDPDDSNYVILPDMTGRFCMMETNPQNVGILHDAQAPNNVGTLGVDAIDSDSSNGLVWGPSGVFYGEGTNHTAAYTPSQMRDPPGLVFDLSRGNSIYSGSDVKPKSISVLALIRI